ncbi:MAG: hypothetical protein QNJ41_23845 [Xenococcaceae cyanobacterium MO_188.B32]|nr:hypothetical protein [Xenococcaceae cyanobacterium MO_188.B32]
MKLLATTRLKFTENINTDLIWNSVGQMSSDRGRVNPKQAIQDTFEYINTGYPNENLANHPRSAEDSIGKFYCQLINQCGNETLAHLQAFTTWVLRLTQTTKHLVEKNIDISLEKMNVDSLELRQFPWREYKNNIYNNIYCCQQIARFISGNW